jgi:hypothetical protein
MDQDEKVRENRLRRMAERQGYTLHKSRRRDPLALDFDRWTIVGEDERVIAGADGAGRPTMSLDQVEAHLNGGES